jgi:hypothetical protein
MPPVGGGEGGGGGPPKRDGDWACPGCGNTCFAFRGECNRCKTLRPSGEPPAISLHPTRSPQTQHYLGRPLVNEHAEQRVWILSELIRLGKRLQARVGVEAGAVGGMVRALPLSKHTAGY